MATLAKDIRLALDRVAFAEELGIIPDPWQRDLLRSEAPRVYTALAVLETQLWTGAPG